MTIDANETVGTDVMSIEAEAAHLNFIRLQVSQREFLAWLEAPEHEADDMLHAFRKVR